MDKYKKKRLIIKIQMSDIELKETTKQYEKYLEEFTSTYALQMADSENCVNPDNIELNNENVKNNQDNENSMEINDDDVINKDNPLSIEELMKESNNLPKPKELSDKEKLIKHIYKKIALITHPDKNKKNKKMCRRFMKAKTYVIQKKLNKLILLANKLGIEYNTDYDITNDVEDELNKNKSFISELKNKIAWAWATYEGEQKKTLIDRLYERIWKLDKNKYEK